MRAVQLDLGGQPESLDRIRSFIDFAARHGYNCLELHLMGRVRTKTFPYGSRDESYGPDEIGRIVDYAAARKTEVLANVETFGHVNQFLEHPEFAELAELRGGRTGRFSKFQHVFCPSLSETYQFLDSYLTETAALFPSEYFHVGCDEVWDIGYCDLCRRRLATGETQEDIFTAHLLAVHEIVVGKLKKKMIIWDDMFDPYPGVPNRLPRDIILCAWHYDRLMEKPVGHFGGPAADKLALYDRLGFRYIFAPSTYHSIRNVESFSAYALGRKPLGGLLTIWGGQRPADYPIIAYAGALWSGQGAHISDEDLQSRAIRATTGYREMAQVNLTKAVLNSRHFRLPVRPDDYLRGPLSEPEYQCKFWLEGVIPALASVRTRAAGRLQREVREDLSLDLEEQSLFFELREVLTVLYSLRKSRREEAALKRRLARCRGRLKACRTRRRRQWAGHRKGKMPCPCDAMFDTLLENLGRVPEEAGRTRALLRVRFPDKAPHLEVFVRYWSDKTWRRVKPGRSYDQAPFSGPFQYFFPLRSGRPPESIRLENRGYVGSGVAFLEIETKKGRFVPAEVWVREGKVTNPEALLEDGRDFCFMGEGEQSARRIFLQPEQAGLTHAVEIKLKYKEPYEN